MNELMGVYGRQMDASDRKLINDKRLILFKSLGTFPGMKRKAIAVFTMFFPRLAHVLRRIKKNREFSIEMGEPSQN